MIQERRFPPMSSERVHTTRSSRAGVGPRVALLAVMLLVSGLTLPGMASASSYGVAAWGNNFYGELGNGLSWRDGVEVMTVPVAVDGLSGVTAVAGGREDSLALLSNGTVQAWGRNGSGELGDGTTTESYVPVAVKELSGVKAIAAGGSHNLALLENGTVMAWGDNKYGQLGDGTTSDSDVPVAVKGLSEVTAIAAGYGYSLALLSNGTVVAWGEGALGELGNGGQSNSDVPVTVKELSGVKGVTAGVFQSIAVLSNGAVKAWGANYLGQLGDGTFEGPELCEREIPCSVVPVSVSGISEATAVSAGEEYSLALLSNGTVVSWGTDNTGELGDGGAEREASDVPVAVSGLSDVTKVAAGGESGFAILSNGSLMGWGDNHEGELADGTRRGPEECGVLHGCSVKPVAIGGLSSVTGVAAGERHVLAFGAEFRPGEAPLPEELYGSENLGEPGYQRSCAGDPVNCATGNLAESQTDLAVGGRGIPLTLTRTYNAQAAAAGKHGPFGYGWSAPFSDHLEFSSEAKTVTVVQANGSTVTFKATGEPGELTAPKWAQAKLVLNEGGTYTYTLPDQETFSFDKEGHLLSESDRDGNTTTISRNLEGRLETVTDAAGRKLTFAYNSEGLVESVKDPMGHVVKYAYEGGSLASVTEPGESSPRWRFKYNSEHEITEVVDGRGGKTVNEYNGSHQVTKQEDPTGRKMKFEYETDHTTIINESTGSVTSESFTPGEEPESIARGYGTTNVTTEVFVYNGAGAVTAAIDGNGNVTQYTYDSEGDRTSEKNPDGDETKWTYNSTHDVLTMTTPKGETTTYKREAHGNPEAVERPVPGEKTQVTKYKYGTHGELESVTDPLERTWKYEYDANGDRTAEIDPEGNKRTWEYNEDSQETATVSPRGNVAGAEPAAFATITERDQRGRPVTVTEPQREPVFNFAFGSSGSGNGQFQFPTLEALTSSGNLWVVDSSQNRVQEFNEKGEYQAQFGSAGTGDGQFKFPFGIAIEPSGGVIVVSDREQGRIEEFSSTGAFIRAFGYGVSNGESKLEVCTTECRAGIKGPGVGQLYEPDGVTLDSSGNIYVVDEFQERVEEYNEKGEYIRQFGSKGTEPGQIYEPVDIVYDNGHLYVTEAKNQRVQEFSTTGTYISKFGSEGTGNGQFKVPYAIAAGPTTNELYVTDRENNRVEVFTASGRFLSSFGSKGKGNGQMELPTGVVATASETLYVSDHNNKRVDNWTGLASRVTKYTYDGNGNLETRTDPNGDRTTYTYNADNQPIKIEAPNRAVTETEYDGAGQVIAQIDANKHKIKYARNVLEEVTEVTDPLGHMTKREYDAAGNLKKLEDPAKRATTYKYDQANRLTEVAYSSGKPATVTYEYDKDGDRTKVTDGTGTTRYVYDQLDRLTEAENGHKEVVKYEYDLANEQTKITYPNEKSVTRAFDKDGRLEKVTDWLEHTTRFSYNADSEQVATAFPTGTGGEDAYAYNLSGQMSEAKMLKGTETLASLIYARDSDGQVNSTIDKGSPGAEIAEIIYDQNSRLTKSGATAYEYDSADNPIKIGSATQTFNEANELEKGAGVTYAYNELGERTKTTPEKGSATTYGYDQAGNLTSVERPKEGETPEINDTYAYNGDGLRVSQTISGTTSYFAWDTTEGVPLILSDGTDNYVYGPGGLPFEQINGEGHVTYLHHDQQGSTRLLTGEKGEVIGSYTYTAYGAVQEHTGASTTPLGYDAQYTSSDTGLIYLRARVYDPATAQFLSADPALDITRAPYNYAGDNPVNRRDPTGLSAEGLEGVPCYWPLCGPPPPAVEGVQHGLETVEHSVESVWNAINENEGPNDEGEAELKEKEAQRAKECGEPNPGNLEKLSKREAERILDKAGTDAHTDKGETVGEGEAGHYDYYRDKGTGEIYLVPKSGGEPIPTGLGG